MLVGKGFYAVVTEKAGSAMAIKTIPCRYFASAIREYALVSACRHSAVIQFESVDVTQDSVQITMRKYSTDLGKMLEAGPLSGDDYARMSHDLFSAVAYLHARGIIHADIKPPNLLVTDSRGLVLADFGISIMASESNHTTYVQSPAYRAPEVNYGRARSSFDHRADNWSIGCVLFEMMTGKPFVAAADAEDDATIHICRIFDLPVFKKRTDRLKMLDFVGHDFVWSRISARIPKDCPVEHSNPMCEFLIPNRCKRMTPSCALASRGRPVVLIEKIQIPIHDPLSMGVIVGLESCVISRVTFDCLCLAEEIYMHTRVIDTPTFVRLAAIYVAVCLHSGIEPLDNFLKEKKLYVEVISVVMRMLPELASLF